MLQRMLGREVRDRHLRRRRSPARSSTRSARAASRSPHVGEGDYRFLSTGDVEAFRALGRASCSSRSATVEHVALHAAEAAA